MFFGPLFAKIITLVAFLLHSAYSNPLPFLPPFLYILLSKFNFILSVLQDLNFFLSLSIHFYFGVTSSLSFFPFSPFSFPFISFVLYRQFPLSTVHLSCPFPTSSTFPFHFHFPFISSFIMPSHFIIHTLIIKTDISPVSSMYIYPTSSGDWWFSLRLFIISHCSYQQSPPSLTTIHSSLPCVVMYRVGTGRFFLLFFSWRCALQWRSLLSRFCFPLLLFCLFFFTRSPSKDLSSWFREVCFPSRPACPFFFSYLYLYSFTFIFYYHVLIRHYKQHKNMLIFILNLFCSLFVLFTLLQCHACRLLFSFKADFLLLYNGYMGRVQHFFFKQ